MRNPFPPVAAALLGALLLNCTASRGPAPVPYDFLLGTYDGEGHAPGVYRLTLAPDGSLTGQRRVATASNPSFLAHGPRPGQLIAVEELTEGRVVSFLPSGDSLRQVNAVTADGAYPCHVSVSQNGTVAVSNYGGGNVVTYQVEPDGSLTPPLDVEDHRQRGATQPHAHSTYFLEGNRAVSADLGTDELWLYRFNARTGQFDPAEPPTVKLPAGAGPRHLAFHPSGRWMYVINELNSTVSQLDRDQPTVLGSWPTLPEDYRGKNQCADIHISADGRFLYGSNRGHNSIAVFAIDADSGALTPLQHASVAGDWPRNFALSPDGRFILVANQRSNNITTLARHPRRGTLELVGSTPAPTPVCILFGL